MNALLPFLEIILFTSVTVLLLLASGLLVVDLEGVTLESVAFIVVAPAVVL